MANVEQYGQVSVQAEMNGFKSLIGPHVLMRELTMDFMDSPDSPGRYLERRKKRLSRFEKISEELGDALEYKLDAEIFKHVSHYLPTLERLLEEHKADSVRDHSLSLLHQDDLFEMGGDIEDFREICNILAAEGHSQT